MEDNFLKDRGRLMQYFEYKEILLRYTSLLQQEINADDYKSYSKLLKGYLKIFRLSLSTPLEIFPNLISDVHTELNIGLNNNNPPTLNNNTPQIMRRDDPRTDIIPTLEYYIGNRMNNNIENIVNKCSLLIDNIKLSAEAFTLSIDVNIDRQKHEAITQTNILYIKIGVAVTVISLFINSLVGIISLSHITSN